MGNGPIYALLDTFPPPPPLGHWSRGEKESQKQRRKKSKSQMEELVMPEVVLLRCGRGMYSIIAFPSFWTCLALIAAAVRIFWRATAITTTSSDSPTSVTESLKNDRLEEVEEPIATDPIPPSPDYYFRPILPEKKGAAFEDASCFFDGEISDGEEEIEEDGSSGFAGVVVGRGKEEGEEGGGVEWWRGDLGWYRFVDLTVLNGSVVKLWDDDRGEKDSRRLKRYLHRSPVVMRTRANWELR